MVQNQRGSLLIVVCEAAQLEMDPFLRTELKDGLDLDAGQLALVLVAAGWEMFCQAGVEG